MKKLMMILMTAALVGCGAGEGYDENGNYVGTPENPVVNNVQPTNPPVVMPPPLLVCGIVVNGVNTEVPCPLPPTNG